MIPANARRWIVIALALGAMGSAVAALALTA